MNRQEVINRIKESGIVAVIRVETPDIAIHIADICAETGIAAIEIAFTVPGAHNIIEQLAIKYENSGLIIGAGTVLDTETARIAILSGARYIISPYLNRAVVEMCNVYQVPSMPGAMTVKETAECMEAGADMVKIFPGELFGPAIIKAIKGPLPQARLMPTGGVTVENAANWLRAGAEALGVGGSLTAGAKTGNFKLVKDTAARFIEVIKNVRSEMENG